jgi:subtilase family serine protease
MDEHRPERAARAGRRMAPGAALALAALAVTTAAAAPAPLRRASVSPLLGATRDLGRAVASRRHGIVVGLELRNRDALEAFLGTRTRALTPDEFNALYAPTPADEEAVAAHLTANGLRITERFPNRLLLAAEGSVAALERAFGVEIHDVEHGGRRHYAAINEPTLPAHLAPIVVGVIGLDDLSERHRRSRTTGPVSAPNAALGTHCCAFSPNDLAAFYDDPAGFDGSGQTIVVAGAFAWSDADNTTFNAQWGLPSLPAGSGQICVGPANSAGCQFSDKDSIEIALDVEYAHGVAPGARILNYMAASTTDPDFTQMYNRIVTDNPGHVVTTSWGACEVGLSAATQLTDDNIFANANAIGQSWFAASGDNGSRDCGNRLSVDNPANSPHVMGVGGTTPTCSSGMTAGSPACGGYATETAWSGSGGGVSQLFARPAFQTGCGVPAGNKRLVPDVALEGDPTPGNYVVQSGSWFIVGGTSGGAPQWAALVAQLNQKFGSAGIGNPGALLYGLCGTAAFHDVTSGANGDYSAGVGYDLVTGLGTPGGTDLFARATPPTSTTTSTSVTTTSTSRTTTTSTSSTTTTAIGATSTTSTSTTSTPTQPSTSSTRPLPTTTLPCAADGFAGLHCAVGRGLARVECGGQ